MVFYDCEKEVIGKRRYDSKREKDPVFMDLSPLLNEFEWNLAYQWFNRGKPDPIYISKQAKVHPMCVWW